MLVDPPIEKLLKHVENRYCLAIAVSKRCRQLVNGGLPLVVSESTNEVTKACEELAQDYIVGVMHDVKPAVPLRPDVVARKRQERELRFQEMEDKARAAERNELLAKQAVSYEPESYEEEQVTGGDILDQNVDSLESLIEAESADVEEEM